MIFNHLTIISFPELLDYVERVGQEGNVKYVSRTTKAKSSTFYCFRSGNTRDSMAKGTRRPRSVGASRIGVFCPSQIQVERSDNAITIKFQTRHCDHDTDIGRLSISVAERKNIEHQLLEGVETDKIIDKIRDGAKALTPYTLINCQDVNNIKRALGLFEGKLDKNDYRSVQLWVDKLRAQSSNPILYYEAGSYDETTQETQSFMLVFARPIQLQLLAEHGNGGSVNMDATHNTSGYGYQLASILVTDAFGNGVATAFCLSKGSSQNEWAKFLTIVKEELVRINGDEFHLKAKALMTDMDNSFYNAWVHVFGEIQHLYCGFHVRDAWNRKLKSVSYN